MAFLIVYNLITSIATAANFRNLAWDGAWTVPWYVPVLFLYNFWIVISHDLNPLVLSILWTLSVEEQFYVTMPWLVRFVEPKRMLRIAIGGVFVAIALRLVGLAAMKVYRTYWSMLMPCRMDSLLLGFIAAVIWRNPEWCARFAKWKTLHRILVILLGAGFLYYTARPAYELRERWGLAIGLTWTSALHFLLLMYSLLHKDGILGRVLRLGWLRWLGGIAYGVYLFHRLFMETVTNLIWRSSTVEVTTLGQLVLYLVIFAAMLVFCRLLYVFYEQPFLKLGHKVAYGFPQVSSPLQRASVLSPAEGPQTVSTVLQE
jgi:peptidoglycan/LPS O-acetylase OafA/YrhL